MLSKKTDFSLLLCQIIFGNFLLLFCSCGNNEPMPVIDATVVFQNVTPQNSAEILTISATVDTVIRLKEGTIIAIEENSFADADGNLITGEVEISVKEVISTADILSENMSTVTKEGILETAGMLKIDATSEGKTVQVADGKTLEIAFPKVSSKEKNMELYYGVENEIGVLEWEAAEMLSKYDSLNNLNSENRQKRKILQRHGTISWGGDGFDLLSGYPEIDTLLVFSDEEKEKITDIWQEGFSVGKYFAVDFLLHEDGDFHVLRIQAPFSEPRKEELKKRLDAVSYVNPVIREDKAIDVTGRLFISFVEYDFDLMRPEDYSNYYLLNTTKLGWINCDFFLEFTEPKIEMAITAPNKNTALKMMFTNYRTIMTGDFKDGKYVFANIPQGEPVKIIAISKEDDKAGFSLTETVVQEELKELQPLEIMSDAALNDKIAKL